MIVQLVCKHARKQYAKLSCLSETKEQLGPKKIWVFQHRDASIRPTHQPWTQQFPGILQSRPGSLVVAISCLMVCLRGLDSSRHPANIATLTIIRTI